MVCNEWSFVFRWIIPSGVLGTSSLPFIHRSLYLRWRRRAFITRSRMYVCTMLKTSFLCIDSLLYHNLKDCTVWHLYVIVCLCYTFVYWEVCFESSYLISCTVNTMYVSVQFYCFNCSVCVHSEGEACPFSYSFLCVSFFHFGRSLFWFSSSLLRFLLVCVFPLNCACTRLFLFFLFYNVVFSKLYMKCKVLWIFAKTFVNESEREKESDKA